jgi:hypothetical protein
MESRRTSVRHAHRHASALIDATQEWAKYVHPHEKRGFSKYQLELALHLANDFSGPQRKDAELLNHMRMKQMNRQGATMNDSQALAATSKRILQTRSDDNWEALALQGINKKALSLDRGWNEKTWTNKSSIYERLKLLKDDGVNITPLKSPKVSSESITKAVLARAVARKQNPSSRVGSESSSSKHTDSPEAIEPEVNTYNPSDDSFFDHLQYRPGPTPLLKRKRNTSPDIELVELLEFSYTSNKDEPASKKQCKSDLRTTCKEATIQCEEEVFSWDVLKHKILTHIFSLSPSTKDIQTIPYRIVIAFPSQTAVVDVPGDLDLNSKGYENIMREFCALSSTIDEEGTVFIQDLAAPHSQIRIVRNIPHRTIIEGNAEALTGLISRLRTPGNGLAHMAKRFFNEDGVRQSKGQPYELSTRTQKQLERIEEALKEGCEVGVRWYNVGRSPGWPKKMY